jgi:hypothetical protein
MRSDRLGDKSFARTISFLTMAIAMVVALVAPIGMSQASAQSDVVIQTRVQVLHASPSLGKVEVFFNDKESLDEFSYGDQSDWIDIDPGSVRVTITADRAGFNYAVFDAVYPVPAGNDYTLIISDALILASAIDTSPTLDGLARVQVVQASVDLPAVNVVATGSDVDFATQLTYPRSSEYQAVPAGTYDFEVTLADTGDVVVTQPGVVLEGNMVYQLVIMGSVGNEDHPLEVRTISDATKSESATPTP